MTIPFADSEFAARRPISMRLSRASTRDNQLRDPVDLFTDTVAVRCGVNYAVSRATGSDADLLALLATGIQPGDAVVASPFVPTHTVAALATLGARPLFADIDARTIALDPSTALATLEDACSEEVDDEGRTHLVTQSGSRVRAILVFHPFGQIAAVKRLRPLAHDFNLPLVEIAGAAFGARERDAGELTPAGGWGDLATINFDSTSSLTSPGDGGIVVARTEEWFDRLGAAQSQVPEERRYQALELREGLDPFVAEVLLARLAGHDQTIMRRRSLAGAYRQLLAPLVEQGGIRFVDPNPEAHGYQRFVIRVRERERLTRALARERIGHAVYHPTALSVRPGMRELGYKPQRCPEAERAAQELIALPLHPSLLPGDQDHVAQIITDALRS